MKRKKNCIKVSTTREHHSALVEAAQREQVSLNQYCVYMLSLAAASDIEDDGFDDLFKIRCEDCILPYPGRCPEHS